MDARERYDELADFLTFQPFRHWVVVPAAHADRWDQLAEDALTPPAG